MNGFSVPTRWRGRFVDSQRFVIVVLFLSSLLLLALATVAVAQTEVPGVNAAAQTRPQDAQSAPNSNTTKNKPRDRQSDLRALDRVLTLLRDKRARTQLVDDIERLRSGTVTTDNAGKAKATSGKGKSEEGLLDAVTHAVKTAGKKAPQALAAPLDQKVNEAADEIHRQFDTAFEQGVIQSFAIAAVPGWLLALAVALGINAAGFVRRGKSRLAEAVVAKADNGDIVRAVLARAVWGFLPLACGAAIIGVWPFVLGVDDEWARVFFSFAIPVLVAGIVWQLTRGLLALLGPSRGWRRSVYAQRRIVPWLSGLAAAAAASAILRSSYIWDVLSASVADVAAIVLDLGIGCATLVFIFRYRLLVRSLMIRRHKPSNAPKQVSPLWRGYSILAKQWHIVGIVFVLAHMLARLLGGDVDFVLSSLLSLAVIIAGLMVALSVDASLAYRVKKQKRFADSVVRRISARYLQIVRVFAQVFIVALIGLIGFKIWGLNIDALLGSKIGWSILRPVLSILAALTFGWMLWTALDSFIENALSTVDRHGRKRAQSSRTMTLLPLIRNVVFVVLCAVIVVAVLANLGINVAPLLAGAGIVGLAIGFGSQQLVQDLITGLFILFEGSISVGDTIDTGGRAGVVEAMTLRTVKIRDVDGALHSVPFSQITALKNHSRDYGVYTVKATVGYGTDLDRVIEIMRDIGQELQADATYSWDILTPLDIWGVDQFAPDGVVVIGVIKTRPLRQWSVGREFNLRLKKRFDAEGIPMATPTLSLINSQAQTNGKGKAAPVAEAAPSI
ncbi:MAG: mechanosensitive ion channel [Gammaproteobacteria bacterium]|nr:mechanosensitive ion channel [Gammaproteobacteria bacterium]